MAQKEVHRNPRPGWVRQAGRRLEREFTIAAKMRKNSLPIL
jgi:hypothetical protein